MPTVFIAPEATPAPIRKYAHVSIKSRMAVLNLWQLRYLRRVRVNPKEVFLENRLLLVAFSIGGILQRGAFTLSLPATLKIVPSMATGDFAQTGRVRNWRRSESDFMEYVSRSA
jgi:hypothetical protein